jgi:lipopolysaccharide biosynthesis protein
VYPDNKAGLIQFTPKPTAAGMAPSILAANIMSGGGAVPQMVRIRYRAGLSPQHERMAEIEDLIMRMAMLRQIKFAPQSASISADGLSQSKSFDVDKFGAAIDAECQDLRDSIRGPIWSVL